MPDTVTNYGINPATWIGFGMAVITIIILYHTIKAAIKVGKADEEEDNPEVAVELKKYRLKQVWTRFVFMTIFLTVTIIFFYFGFGPGEPVRLTPAESDGMRQMTEEMPDEKTDSVIQEEAYEKKPHELRRQDDPGFEEEQKQADDYIEKVLERARKRDSLDSDN